MTTKDKSADKAQKLTPEVLAEIDKAIRFSAPWLDRDATISSLLAHIRALELELAQTRAICGPTIKQLRSALVAAEQSAEQYRKALERLVGVSTSSNPQHWIDAMDEARATLAEPQETSDGQLKT